MGFFEKLFGKADTPTRAFRVWFKEKALAMKYVANDPTGLYPDLLMLLSFQAIQGNGVSDAEHIAIIGAVKKGKYKIVPSVNNGNNGFDLVIFY